MPAAWCLQRTLPLRNAPSQRPHLALSGPRMASSVQLQETSLLHHFDLVSHWRLNAPVEQVWAALTDPERWPLWWPYVRSVRLLQPGGSDGLGSVRLFHWGTRLPYDIEIEIESIESVRHQRIRGRSRGQLHGEGIWLLRAEADYTDVTTVWRVDLGRRWMRWSAPLLAPLFRWNHDGVMRAGGAGLARYLAREAVAGA